MLTVSDNHIILGGGGGGGGGGASTFAALTDKTTADIPATNTPTATALNARELSSNKKIDVDANKASDVFFPTVKAVFDWVSGLFVKGAASSTDNAIVRFDGSTGKFVKNGTVTIDDTGALSNVRTINTSATSSQTNFLTGFAGDTPSTIVFGISISRNGVFGTLTNNNFEVRTNNTARLFIPGNGSGITIGGGLAQPTAMLDLYGTSKFRDNATFNGQIIDNVGSSGVDGQVLKKVGGLVIWANP